MALLKTFGRIDQLTGQNARICAYMARRGYAAEASEMSFTFATPAESFYSDAKVKQVCFFLPARVPAITQQPPSSINQ